MKLSREKLIELNRTFDKFSSEKASVFFHYKINKNKQKIADELKILEDIQKRPSDGYIAYEKERVTICEELCDKDESGKPVILDYNTPSARYSFTQASLSEVDSKIEDLKLKHKEAIEEFENNKKEFAQLLSEEIEVEFSLFSINDMPKEVIGADINLLFDLIKDE